MNSKIYVVTHKPVDLPTVSGNEPLLVGAYNKKYKSIFRLRDDTGDNISVKNPNYCELTGVYWIWKNEDVDAVGICHYRRFFTKSLYSSNPKYFLTDKDINRYLKKYDVIIPKKWHYEENVRVSAVDAPNQQDLLEMAEALEQVAPDYLETYYEFLNGGESSLYNMAVMKKDMFDEYCEWLFAVLGYVEDHHDIDQEVDYRKRLYGFLSERLLYVWLMKNVAPERMKEVRVVKTDETAFRNFLHTLKDHYRKAYHRYFFKERPDVYVVTHKQNRFPLPAYCQWIQVNAAKNGAWADYLHDNEGDHISFKNNSYCELTALYTLWKQSNAEYKGLYHYRRFLGKGTTKRFLDTLPEKISASRIPAQLLTERDIKTYLKRADIILAEPLNPYPATVLEDLQRFVYPEDIQTMISIVETEFPDYAEALHTVLASKSISYCNMFIAKAPVADAYCEWLFAVLERVEDLVDISTYDTAHQRIFGYLSEVLLNVYVEQHHLKPHYAKLLTLEEQPDPVWKQAAVSAVKTALSLTGLLQKRGYNRIKMAQIAYLKKQKEPDCQLIAKQGLIPYLTALGAYDIHPLETDLQDVECVSSLWGPYQVLYYRCNDRSRLEDIQHHYETYLEAHPSAFEHRIMMRVFFDHP